MPDNWVALLNIALPTAEYAPPQMPWNRIMVVGEAPGAEEIRLNRPFVGRSGQLLDKALAAAGIERAACFVANVFRTQPPGNKVDHFFASRRAAVQAGEILDESWGAFGGKYCRSAYTHEPAQLRQTISAQRPAVILVVGRTPLWALTGENGITALAGQQRPCRWFPAIPVVITYHPSYILRGNWALMPEWSGHMRQAAQIAQRAAV